MNLYTVYDRLAEAAGPPFSAPNHAVARRMYAQLINGVECDPKEYRLMYMGSYDEKSCVLEPQGIPEDLYVDAHKEISEVALEMRMPQKMIERRNRDGGN